MSAFTAAETAACVHLIELALKEDLGPAQRVDDDVTTRWFAGGAGPGRVALVARTAGVLAGLPAAELVFGAVDPRLRFERLVVDGTALKPGDRLARVAGEMGSILVGERTALNFVQQLSGIASLTARYVQAVAGLPCKILDTRKTIPGWRLLAKYAVRQGGGHNHRMGLYDMALVKDNHWAAGVALPPLADRVAAFRAARPGVPIEIEVDNLDQLDEILPCRPDIVLLDNMPPAVLREAVRRRDAAAPGVLLEASGGVNLQTVRALAESGVDRISVGALTHSAPALDIGLDYEPATEVSARG